MLSTVNNIDWLFLAVIALLVGCLILLLRYTRLYYSEHKKLLSLANKLTDKNEELHDYIYATTHDLRTPLVNIKGFSRELNKDCDKIRNLFEHLEMPDSDNKKSIETLFGNTSESLKFVHAGIGKIDKLLEGLLDIADVSSEKIEIVEIDMSNLIEEVLNELQFQIRTSSIEIVVGHLPHCKADAVEANRLFSNLINNAIKYLDPHRKGRIDITGWKNGNFTTYCVRDNGIGIDSKYKDDVFKLFHRLNPDINSDGQGIGLNIVKKIVERNNGRVWLKSEPGVGSEFCVEFPAIKYF